MAEIRNGNGRSNRGNGGKSFGIGPAEVCALYSVSVILLIMTAARFQRREFYTGILVTEFVLVLVPPLVLLALRKPDISRFLRLRWPGFLSFFLVFWIMLFAIPVANMLNIIYMILIKAVFGHIVIPAVPVASGLNTLIMSILVVGGSAGICEEILFRGVVMRGLERFGQGRAVVFTAVLFGMWHIYFQSFFGTFILGLLIGYVVYLSDSLYCGMFAHFMNNAFAVTAGYLSSKYLSGLKNSGLKGLGNSEDIDAYTGSLMHLHGFQLASVIFSWIFIIVFCGSILFGLLVAFIRMNGSRRKTPGIPGPGAQEQEVQGPGVLEIRGTQAVLEKPAVKSFLWLLPALVFIGFMYWCSGLLLTGGKSAFAEAVLRIFGMR